MLLLWAEHTLSEQGMLLERNPKPASLLDIDGMNASFRVRTENLRRLNEWLRQYPAHSAEWFAAKLTRTALVAPPPVEMYETFENQSRESATLRAVVGDLWLRFETERLQPDAEMGRKARARIVKAAHAGGEQRSEAAGRDLERVRREAVEYRRTTPYSPDSSSRELARTLAVRLNMKESSVRDRLRRLRIR